VACVLEQGSGRNDAILLVQAMAPGADLPALAALARALAAGRERAVEMDATGAAFVRAVAAAGGPRLPDLPQAVAVGAAARGLGMAPATVAALWLQGFAGTLVQAGVRFVPLGQSEGLAAMAALEPLILALADEAAAAGLDDLGGAAFGADLASLAHETLDVRMFRT
jgi:urease accessory protein